MRLALILLLATSPALAKDLTLKSSEVTYDVSYVTKTVHGVSHEGAGKIRCPEKGDACEFLIAVPVRSFDSGNANRDSHMLEATKGLSSPQTTMSGCQRSIHAASSGSGN